MKEILCNKGLMSHRVQTDKSRAEVKGIKSHSNHFERKLSARQRAYEMNIRDMEIIIVFTKNILYITNIHLIWDLVFSYLSCIYLLNTTH